jgi:hypothetical protein
MTAQELTKQLCHYLRNTLASDEANPSIIATVKEFLEKGVDPSLPEDPYSGPPIIDAIQMMHDIEVVRLLYYDTFDKNMKSKYSDWIHDYQWGYDICATRYHSIDNILTLKYKESIYHSYYVERAIIEKYNAIKPHGRDMLYYPDDSEESDPDQRPFQEELIRDHIETEKEKKRSTYLQKTIQAYCDFLGIDYHYIQTREEELPDDFAKQWNE